VREEPKIELDAEDGVEFTVLPQGALAPVVDGPIELARMNAAVATSVAGHAAAEDAYSAFDAVTSVRRFATYKPELLAPHLWVPCAAAIWSSHQARARALSSAAWC
jgi:hypothetical protein